jgi:hypothetical protein
MMFDKSKSSQLDAVIILLEAPQPILIRLALRYLKRRLEQSIACPISRSRSR